MVVVSSFPKCASVGEDILVKILANIFVNGDRGAIRLVVVTGGDDQINIPAVDECGDIFQWLTCQAVISDDGKAQYGPRRGRRHL